MLLGGVHEKLAGAMILSVIDSNVVALVTLQWVGGGCPRLMRKVGCVRLQTEAFSSALRGNLVFS